jgi:glycosyltransferase involved in cell wall biosynthesis
MAVKDGERFLEKSVQSIFGQTISNLELIVVDDGSTDRTSEILDRFGDARMKIVTQPNRGLAASLNRGVSLARAELVARMDADDIAVQGRLHAQFEFMNANPEIGLVGTATTVIDEAGDEKGQWNPPVSDGDIRSALMRANQFAHASVMFRKSVFDSVGGYSDMPFAQDYDLWLRMAGVARVANLPEPLLYRRETADQFGTGRETQQIRWAVRARMNAMKRGDYSPLAARHIVKPAIASMMPGPFREMVRRIGGQKAA